MKQEDITNAIGRNQSSVRSSKGRVSRRATAEVDQPSTANTAAPSQPPQTDTPQKSMKRSTTTVNLYEYQIQEIDQITNRLKELGWGRAARIHFMRASIAVMLEQIQPADINEIIRSEPELEAYMRKEISP